MRYRKMAYIIVDDVEDHEQAEQRIEGDISVINRTINNFEIQLFSVGVESMDWENKNA
jgi:hypothetical protein